MARIDWGKARRVQHWRESQRSAWSGTVPPAGKKPSIKQLLYLQALLERSGRRPYTDQELAALTFAGASALIDTLKAACNNS